MCMCVYVIRLETFLGLKRRYVMSSSARCRNWRTADVTRWGYNVLFPAAGADWLRRGHVRQRRLHVLRSTWRVRLMIVLRLVRMREGRRHSMG